MALTRGYSFSPNSVEVQKDDEDEDKDEKDVQALQDQARWEMNNFVSRALAADSKDKVRRPARLRFLGYFINDDVARCVQQTGPTVGILQRAWVKVSRVS